VQYTIPCSSAQVPGEAPPQADSREEQVPVPAPATPGKYHIVVILQYRKVDQYLLDYLFGEGKITAPVTELTRATATVEVKGKDQAAVLSPNREAQVADTSR